MRGELVEIIEGVLRHSNKMLRLRSRYWSFYSDAKGEDWFAHLFDISFVMNISKIHARCLLPNPSSPAVVDLLCKLLLSSAILAILGRQRLPKRRRLRA